MHNKLGERLALVGVSFVGGVAVCALLLPRPLAAANGAPWLGQLNGPTAVLLQFNDGQAVGTSPWYAGTVKGYDGSMIVFSNETTPDETIFMPLSGIRQIQVKK